MSLRNLSDDQIIEGIKKSYTNADSLLSDAFTLAESKKFPRAYTLCQLAIEEFAKAPLLFSVLMERLEGSNIDYEKYDRTFLNHSMKTELGIDWEIAMFKQFKEETGENFIDKIINNSTNYYSKLKNFNDLKNESLYVSINNNNFQSPSEVIDESKYNSIAGIASMRKIMLQVFAKIDVKIISEIKSAIEENKK